MVTDAPTKWVGNCLQNKKGAGRGRGGGPSRLPYKDLGDRPEFCIQLREES